MTRNDKDALIISLRERVEELEQQLAGYAERFGGLGLWTPTDSLRDALSSIDPKAEAFVLIPTVMFLNLETGRLEERKHRIHVAAQ